MALNLSKLFGRGSGTTADVPASAGNPENGLGGPDTAQAHDKYATWKSAISTGRPQLRGSWFGTARRFPTQPSLTRARRTTASPWVQSGVPASTTFRGMRARPRESRKM